MKEYTTKEEEKALADHGPLKADYVLNEVSNIVSDYVASAPPANNRVASH